MDNWMHRSERMRCRTCMWFAPKEKAQASAAVASASAVSGAVNAMTLGTAQTGPALGRCRRHAPTMGGFPVVFQTDWCGDHKLDENAV